MESGTYSYTVSAEGYVEKTEIFVVETEAQTVAVDLEKDPSYVTTSAELEAALKNEELTEITIDGQIGSTSDYTVYTLERDDVIIEGSKGAKVFGTFIIKGDNVTIDGLAIENKGDATGSTSHRTAIYVYADSVTITGNTITNSLGASGGIANGIQLMRKSATLNELNDYVIENNKITGFGSTEGKWGSAGIVITQGFNSGTVGGYANPITVGYDAILNSNTIEDNEINLTHQDWSKSGDEVVLYVDPVQEIDEEP